MKTRTKLIGIVPFSLLLLSGCSCGTKPTTFIFDERGSQAISGTTVVNFTGYCNTAKKVIPTAISEECHFVDLEYYDVNHIRRSYNPRLIQINVQITPSLEQKYPYDVKIELIHDEPGYPEGTFFFDFAIVWKEGKNHKFSTTLNNFVIFSVE